MPLDWKWIPPLSMQQLEHLFEKIDTSTPDLDGCYLWEGATNDAGYGIITLNRARFRATRVIYFVVTGVDPEDKLIRHTCDNKLCVRYEHMVLGTNDDNMRDAKERGRFASGDRNGMNTHPEKRTLGENQKLSKLKNEQVIEARNLYSQGMKCEAVAQYLGVTLDIASKIIRGKLWKHVGGPIVTGYLPKTGKREPYGELNQKIADEIRRKKNTGAGVMALAAEYGISRASVYAVLKGKRWA